MKSKPTFLRYTVPIYDCTLYLSVGHTIEKAFARLPKSFGKLQYPYAWGLTCWNDLGSIAIVLTYEHLEMKVVSHEVFHTTHRIMEWASCNFDENHHEQGAMLHGHLMSWINGKVRIGK